MSFLQKLWVTLTAQRDPTLSSDSSTPICRELNILYFTLHLKSEYETKTYGHAEFTVLSNV